MIDIKNARNGKLHDT